jgi:hypothetical protein
MTVSELIAELQKFPGHHRVFVEHETDVNYETGMPNTDWAAVQELRADQQCTVVIDTVRGNG